MKSTTVGPNLPIQLFSMAQDPAKWQKLIIFAVGLVICLKIRVFVKRTQYCLASQGRTFMGSIDKGRSSMEALLVKGGPSLEHCLRGNLFMGITVRE